MVPVPGRKTMAFAQAADWADTMSIWIHPNGKLACKLGHREDQDETGEALTDREHQALLDQDSQRLGLSFLNLLSTAPEPNPIQDNIWKEFMVAISFSGDLLTSLTHAIATPLTDDMTIASLQGVMSLYRELEVSTKDETEVPTMINLLISEGMLSLVLEKTRLYSQRVGSQPYTDTVALLLTLSLRAVTTDLSIRTELCRVIHILSIEGDVRMHDLLIGCLKNALLRFPWIRPTVRKARTIPLLMTRIDLIGQKSHNDLSDMKSGLWVVLVLNWLCQDPSCCSEILDAGPHLLLQTADKARLMQIFRTDKGDPVGRVDLDIQLAAIECITSMTTPRPQTDHLNGTIRTPLGWNVETIWNWTLQTMLVLKNLTTHYRPYSTVPKYAIGFQTLHHLFIMEAQLTIEQNENASLLLGREKKYPICMPISYVPSFRSQMEMS